MRRQHYRAWCRIEHRAKGKAVFQAERWDQLKEARLPRHYRLSTEDLDEGDTTQ